jgi:hypothetical protein
MSEVRRASAGLEECIPCRRKRPCAPPFTHDLPLAVLLSHVDYQYSCGDVSAMRRTKAVQIDEEPPNGAI